MKSKRIEASLRTIFKGSLIVLCGSLVGNLLNLLFKVIAARHYGREEYGWFSLAVAVIVIGANISSLGMNQTVARFIPFFEERDELGKMSYSITFGAKVSLLASILLGLTIFITSPWLSRAMHADERFTVFLMFFATVVPFEVIFDYSLGILRGMKDMTIMALCNNVILWVARIGLLGLIVLIGLGVQWMVLPYFVSYVVSLGVIWQYLRKKSSISKGMISSPSGRGNRALRRELVSYSLPLVLSSITSVLQKRLDVVLVGLFLTASQVGLYNVALPLAMLMTAFLFALNRIAMPVASGLFGGRSEEEMEYVYKSMAKWSLMVTLPIFFTLFFFSERIIGVFFGIEYIEGCTALRILSVGFFVNAVSGSFGEYLQAYTKTKSIFLISITGTALNLALMVLLIPKYGIEGAAVAVCASLVWMCLLGCFCLYRHKKILPFSKEYLHTFNIGGLFFSFFYIMQKYFIGLVNDYALTILFVIGLAIYIILLYWLATNEFDREIVRTIMKRSSRILQGAR